MASETGNVTYIESAKFSDVITAFKDGINEYNDITNKVVKATDTLLMNWKGEGRTQFEKDYNTIYRQLNDLADIMYELYDSLIDAQAAYIQTDEELAKLNTM